MGPWKLAPSHTGKASQKKRPANAGLLRGVSEGTRTPDRLDHNQELYQLSYAHRAG